MGTSVNDIMKLTNVFWGYTVGTMQPLSFLWDVLGRGFEMLLLNMSRHGIKTHSYIIWYSVEHDWVSFPNHIWDCADGLIVKQ